MKKKLILKKEVIAKLNDREMNQLIGGATLSLTCATRDCTIDPNNCGAITNITCPSGCGCPTTNEPTMAC